MRAALLVALCACTIKPADYSGKACSDGACPAGYTCNFATNTCANDIVIDGATTTTDSDAKSPDAGDQVTDSCLPNPRSSPVYATAGFGDYPQGWLVGDGEWSRVEGELRQTSTTTDPTWISRTITSPNTGDYRLVSTMRLTEFDTGSIGIAFRVSSQSFHGCMIEPATGRLAITYSQAGFTMMMVSKQLIITDPRVAFTMEVDASFGTLTCCIRGIADSTLSVPNAVLLAGRAGLTTTEIQAAFASFYAYQ